MHYYKFNIGDYASHTQHLDEIEDLAYRRMLDWLYLNEMPLPSKAEEIARLIRMRTHCERIADVLREFFTLTEEGYINERVSRELAGYQEKSEKAKKSAQARWEKKPSKSEGLGDANALRKECEGNAKHKTINTKQETLNNKQETKDNTAQQVREIFEYWVDVFNKNGATKLTADRAQKVRARLKEGYTVEQIQCAILGCSKDAWHVEKGVNDLEYICRKGSNVERLMSSNQPAKPKSQALDDWANGNDAGSVFSPALRVIGDH